MSDSDTIAINSLMGNIFTQMSNITGNSSSTYNLLNRVVYQQSNITDLINNGNGNISTGNLIINNSLNINGNLTYSNLNLIGNLTMSNGNISSTIGNVLLSNGNILSTRGNIVLNNGNINSTIGNISMSNGNLISTIGNLIVSNGDANISGDLYLQGLATILGQSGFKVDYGVSGSSTSSTTPVFDSPFNTVPTIIATGRRDSATPSICYVTVVSTTGATIVSRDDGGAGVQAFIYWIAIGT